MRSTGDARRSARLRGSLSKEVEEDGMTAQRDDVARIS
jgi:hypothetical protein